MAEELAWYGDILRSRCVRHWSDDVPDLSKRDASRPKKSRPGFGHRDNGGFHPEEARPPIEDQVDAIAEPNYDMLRAGRTDVAKRVGAGGGDRDAPLQQRRPVNRPIDVDGPQEWMLRP